MVSKPILVIGADPGTGSSSDTGFGVFDPNSKELFYAANIGTKKRELHHRIKDISDIFQNTINEIDGQYQDHLILVCIEQFVMRGKGGESLQRLIGSLMGRIPYHFVLKHVQNTTVKLVLAGHGHADKTLVAQGVLEFFSDNEQTSHHIKRLIEAKEFDIIDALAIGITGWKMCQQPKLNEPAKRRRR